MHARGVMHMHGRGMQVSTVILCGVACPGMVCSRVGNVTAALFVNMFTSSSHDAGRMLHKGRCATTYAGQHKGQTVAVKVILHDRSAANKVANAVTLMSSLHHTNVVRVVDAVLWSQPTATREQLLPSGVAIATANSISTLVQSDVAGVTVVSGGHISILQSDSNPLPDSKPPVIGGLLLDVLAGRVAPDATALRAMSGATAANSIETWVVQEYCNNGTLADAMLENGWLYQEDVMQMVRSATSA